MSLVAYAFGEGARSIRRSGRSSAASIGTIAIAFLTLGAFVIAASNAQRIADRWSQAAEMSIYLEDSVDDDTRLALVRLLQAHPAVAAVDYVSREGAIERFRAEFPELGDVTASLEANPFPASVEVRLRAGSTAKTDADALAQSVRGRPGVADVRYDQRWLDRLRLAVASVRLAGLVVSGLLMLGAAFTVLAVVQLSLNARRDEIEIMQLVGAPYSYLRGPFIVEGLLLGGAGAGLALAGLWALSLWVSRGWGSDLVSLFGEGTVRFLSTGEVGLLAAAGLGVGAAAGAVAARAAE